MHGLRRVTRVAPRTLGSLLDLEDAETDEVALLPLSEGVAYRLVKI
jgi:hypothetical protein